MTPKIEQWMRDAAEEIVRNIGAEDWDEGFHDSIAVIIASHAPSEAAAQPTEEHICKPSCHNPCLLDD